MSQDTPGSPQNLPELDAAVRRMRSPQTRP